MILNRRRLYMLPTREGLIFAMVLFVMLLAAANYNNGMIYALTFVLTALGLVSMLYTHRNLSGVVANVGAPAAVFAEDTALFKLSLRNHRNFERASVWVFCADHRQQINIPAEQTVTIEVPVSTVHRGYIECPSVRLSTAYPFGLLYTWSAPILSTLRGIVYPRPLGHNPAPPDISTDSFIESGSRLEGDDFVGLREYREGDPPRHIHWKATASARKPLTKQFGGQGSGEVWFDWESTAGSIDARLSQLCRWIMEAEQKNKPYGLRIPGFSKAPGLGAQHRHQCLKTLALWNLDD